jgi:TonB family protein
LNSGCDEHPVESLLKNYKGIIASPVGAQVRLLDRDKLPFTRYMAPEYPATAAGARIQDRVPLEVEIAPTGKVVNVTVFDGHAMLRPTAVEAARQWEFKPGSPKYQQMTLDFFLQCP